MIFSTQYTQHARRFASPGSREKTVYQAKYDDTGTLDLYPAGVESIYDYIQSHRDSCDIHMILDRFAAGDRDVLSQVQGFYADSTGMPKTYAEVLNSVIAGEHYFDTLPADIKQQFGNSFSRWMAAFDDEDFPTRMGWKQSAPDGTTQDFVRDTPSPVSSSVPAPQTQVEVVQ